MYLQDTASINCPYCGESIEILVDRSVPNQTYIEDCSVCCQPITLTIRAGDELEVTASREDD